MESDNARDATELFFVAKWILQDIDDMGLTKEFTERKAELNGERKIRGYLPTLDGWRAIAILMVILSHWSISFADSPHTLLMLVPRYFMANGTLGVRIFFGISGFLITTRLIPELNLTRGATLKRFYIRRAFRILPPALLLLGGASVLLWMGASRTLLSGRLSAALFYANFDPKIGYYLSHFWSLSVEEHFYMFWPFLLVFLGVRRGVIAACVIAIGAAVYREISPDYLWRSKWTQYHLDGLLWGAVAACLYSYPEKRVFFDRMLRGWRGAAVIAGIFILSFVKQKWLKASLAAYSIQAILIPLGLMATIFQPRWILSRFLEWKPMAWIGRISYGMYLWQQFFTLPNKYRTPVLGVLQTMPLSLICVVFLASASHYLIEKPLMNLGRKLSDKIRVQNDANA